MTQPHVWPASTPDDLADAAHLLHDFNVEYDEPTPDPEWLAGRLDQLVESDSATVLLVEDSQGPEGVAVLRIQPSIWSEASEAYLAELYVVPRRRGQGLGRALLTEIVATSRRCGADYAFVITSADDRAAQRAYAAAGFRRTEGEGGPELLAYERDL